GISIPSISPIKGAHTPAALTTRLAITVWLFVSIVYSLFLYDILTTSLWVMTFKPYCCALSIKEQQNKYELINESVSHSNPPGISSAKKGDSSLISLGSKTLNFKPFSR